MIPTAGFYHRPRRWLAILGAPRSGTTYLLDALSAADRCLGISGEAVPASLPSILNADLAADVRTALTGAVGASLDSFAMQQEYSKAAALAEVARRNIGMSEMLQSVRGRRMLHDVVYKEPFFSFAPDSLEEALPGCRIVHLIRDGRDVADSIVRKYDMLADGRLRLGTNEIPLGRQHDERWIPWWVDEGDGERFLGSTAYVRAAWMWSVMSARTRAFSADRAASGMVLDVHYEQMVVDPLGVGRSIADHLGLTVNRRVRRRLLMANERSVGIHRRRDPAEVADAEEIIGAELDAHGYERGTP